MKSLRHSFFSSLTITQLLSLALLAGCAPIVTTTGSGGSAGNGGSGGDGGDGGAGGGDLSGVQHASCTAPTPDPMPSLPQVNVDATGRPLFDHYRDLDCSGVTGYFCGAAGDFSSCPGGGSAMCLQSDTAVGGVCTYQDSDFWCDGEGEAIGYGDGACWMCAPIESHAAACCAGLAGFDCRAWPYPADGKPGMVCSRHADCEPGLVCGGSIGKGYGICQCPGLAPDSVKPAATCGF